MSSTYSTNLAIELIGSGEQAGTWGTTTNTNLGTLIEQAISGIVTQTITDGADTVITIPNGATGVARNMAIECTGSLTAARNLIVPTNKKLYFIYNNTSGGYAVTVKVSGQTGVSVPNGAKVILMMNSAGTDIVSATNYQASLTLGSALPVTSGGTGVTTSTGSGSNVLSNSPTLVTPNLGTPSTLVGTNITGTAASLSIGGNAATATSPASGGSFITSSNIGSQSVSYATSAGSASTATSATSATSATTAGSVSGGLVWRPYSSNSFTIYYGSWTNTLCTAGDGEIYLIYLQWNVSYSYFRGACIYGGNGGMLNPASGSTQLTIPGGGSYGEQCYINLNGSSQHTAPPYFYVYWFGAAGAGGSYTTATANITIYRLES